MWSNPDPREQIEYQQIKIWECLEVKLRNFKRLTWASPLTYTCISGLDLLKTMAPPRFIKTHLPFQLVPPGFWENKCKVIQSVMLNSWLIAHCEKGGWITTQCFLSLLPDKTIYVARNARDNLVSYYYFDCMNMTQPEPGPWAEYVQKFMRGECKFQLLFTCSETSHSRLKSLKSFLPFTIGMLFTIKCENLFLSIVSWGSWYDHVKGYWREKDNKNILYLFYEDMKEVKETHRS